jgi:DNA-binding NarL/FixJ family response regulator/signal transduction histidine kinase
MGFPTLLEIAVPEQRPLLKDRMRRRVRGETVEERYETALTHKSGRRVDLEVATRLLQTEEKGRQLVVIARDITERKRAEQRLSSSLGALVIIHEAGRVLSSTLKMDEIGTRLLRMMQRASTLSMAIISLRRKGGQLEVLDMLGPKELLRAASTAAEAQGEHSRVLEIQELRLFRLRRCEYCDMPPVGLCLPLVVRDQVTGMIEVYGPEDLTEEATVATLESLTRQAASALENARLHQELAERERQLQDLVGQLLAVQEKERRRVAHDIHDGLTQVAVAAHQTLQVYADDHSAGPVAGTGTLGRALELTEQTVEEARRVIADLRPTVLDELGFAAAMRSQVDSLRTEGWEIGYEEALGEERLPTEIETTLYRVVQEALTNVRKHAQSNQARVTLVRAGERVYLEVRDWGHGFEEAAPPGNGDLGERVGLRSIRERIALVGGEFRIHSRPGAGTLVEAQVPLPHAGPSQGESVPRRQDKTSLTRRILVADDHPLVLEGIQTMLASEEDLNVVLSEARDGWQAIELCRRLRPDLVLMDVRMPNLDGLAATRMIKEEGNATSILMLTTYENPDYLFEAIQAGANGYVIKGGTKQELIRAIRGALNGENPLNQQLAMQLLQRLTGTGKRETSPPPESRKQAKPLHEPLTPRELQVLRLLAQGQTNRQISARLVVSAATVKVHVEHILAKLGASDRTQAAVRASEAGLLNVPE